MSTLRDEELFDRLFHQRHHPNENLKVSAEICSLVYSLNGDGTTSETSELKFLADLAEKTSRELYRDITELQSRGLVQARSVWRAVLPHAIANRLAKDALSSIPTQTVVNALMSRGSERLIKSFSRRLGYLHDCEPAIEIAKEWLKPNGWIGETNCNLNPFGLAVFENIAPVAPEAALTMLERTVEESDGLKRLLRHEFIRLLRHIAYEAELFQRSVKLLSQLALLERPDINNNSSAGRTLSNLFHIVLSGTHAPVQMRAAIINGLIDSSAQAEQDLGVNLLDAALQTDHFIGSDISTFGARSRDYGYHPKTNKEIVDWYRIYLAICLQIAILGTPISIKIKRILASRLRGLWLIGIRFDQSFLVDLEKSAIQIHSQESWNQGWISLNGIIRYDGKQMDQKALISLKQLSQRLKPINLLEQARTYAFADGRLGFDLEDDFDEDEDATEHWKRVQNTTRQIGAAVAKDMVVFGELLPDLVSNYHDRLHIFGEGLADGCEDRKNMWQMLYAQIEITPTERRQIVVLLGFLSSCAMHDPDLYHSILNSLIKDELLGRWFPYFQATSKIDKQGVERLYKALDEGDVDIYSFKQLAWGRRHEEIEDDDLAALIQKLLLKDDGVKVVIEILSMRFHRERGEVAIHSQKLIAVSREVLLQYPYEKDQNGHDHPDYRLEQIADVSMRGQDGVQSAKDLCQRLVEGFQEHRIYSFHYPRLLGRLAQIQPYIFWMHLLGAMNTCSNG